MILNSLAKNGGLHKLLADSFDVVALVNSSFEIIYRSPNAYKVTGWADEARLGINLKHLVHADDLELLWASLNDILKLNGLSKSCILRIVLPNGEYRWIEASFTNFLEDEEVSAIVCHYHDISALTTSDLLLRRTGKELFAYKYALDQSAIIAVTDQKGVIKHINENFCRISGYSAEELIGRDHRILNSAYHDKSYIRNLWVTIAQGKVWKGELKNRAKNGSYYWVDTTIVPFLDDKGKPYQYLAIRSDITERKLAEEKLREEQQHLKLLESVITNTKDSILITEARPAEEPGPRILYVNEAFEQMTGYRSEEVLGKTPRFLQGPKTDRVQMRRMGECLRRWESCEVTVANYKKSGEEFWLNFAVAPVANEHGVFTHWISVGRDITENRKLEDLLDKVTMLARIGGWAVDLKKGTIYWSRITRELHEVGPEFEPDLQSSLKFYKDPKDRERIISLITQASEGGESFDFEAEIVTRKGNGKWVRVIGEPEFEGGQCVRIRGSFQDIDARKKAQLEAMEALVEKKKILESIGDAFFSVDKTWTVNYWNRVAEQVLGKSAAQINGTNLWDTFPDAVGSKSFRLYHEAIQTNSAVHFEDFYTGTGKWYDISAYPSSNGLSVFFKDVTERKHMISALEESEKNYASLFQLSPLPMWVYDVRTLRFLDVNHAAIQHYGYSKQEFLAMTIQEIQLPDDRTQLTEPAGQHAAFMEAVKLGIFRHEKKSGDTMHVDIQSNLIIYKGKPAKIVIANDMTERYNYVRAIEDQNTRFKEIAYIQSHVVRAPLARIMGVVPMLQNLEDFGEDREQLLEILHVAIKELDGIVKEISSKASSIELA